jgi:DNA-3-methyladenine glycosylase II
VDDGIRSVNGYVNGVHRGGAGAPARPAAGRAIAAKSATPGQAVAKRAAVKKMAASKVATKKVAAKKAPAKKAIAGAEKATARTAAAKPRGKTVPAVDAAAALANEEIVAAGAGGALVRKSRAKAAKAVPVTVQIGGLSAEVTRPGYWDKACLDLVKRDRILKKLIPRFGPVHLINRGDPFVTLARSIVGQQITVRAAQAVWDRIEVACPDPLPGKIIKLGFEKLFACGLSKRKAEYIFDLARHFDGGTLHVDTWASMDDEAVIVELTQMRGIGRWTAEMFLIFNLLRPDILPLDDLGLIRAISVNYFSGEPVTRSEAREVAANWEPWRTVATWYMWRSLEPLAVI